jgi:hypothetical protein
VIVPLTSHHLERWQPRLPELEALAQPLLHSQAVQRLRKVTFLGILSPRFRQLPGCPLWRSDVSSVAEDGSRFDHSIGVAVTAVDTARQLGLSADSQRYAAAWGLTHDIATWALSHTSEPALEAVTGMATRQLRTAMVLGRAGAPAPYRIDSALREMNVNPARLDDIFNNATDQADQELALFKQVIHSPLTPDTLEGTWRSGTVFGLPVPAPEEVLPALMRHDGVACLARYHMNIVLDFWNRKAEIYNRYINREDVARWESAWSLALRQGLSGLSLAESLEMPEEEMIEKVQRGGLAAPKALIRYKEMQKYYVNGDLDALPPEPPVTELWRVLRREPAGSPD